MSKLGLQVLRNESLCLDIGNYRKNAGAAVNLYGCPTAKNPNHVKDNEFWAVDGDTIKSLQPKTPFCLGVGTEGATLTSCGDAAAQFTIGFTAAVRRLRHGFGAI